MTALTIKPVQDQAEQESFIRFPWHVYRGVNLDPLWVPPLLSERRDFFRHSPFLDHATVQLFIAYRGTQPVGTISAHLNYAHTARYNDGVGFWGFFEVLDDAQAAMALLDTAAHWVAERGYSTIRGPLNWSVNEEAGLLIDGFDIPPVAMMTYNPPRYVDYMEQAGCYKVKDLYAWLVDAKCVQTHHQGFLKKLGRVARIAQERYQIHVRPIRMHEFKHEIERGWAVYNQAWAENWGAVPMTRAEFEHLAYTLKPMLDPRIMFMAEIAGEPVGVLIAIPDLNRPLRAIDGRLWPFAWYRFLRERRNIDLLRVLIMGVLPCQRRKGIDALLYQATWNAAQKSGYTHAELSWILEDNLVMNQTLAHFGGQHYKTYRIYDRDLT